MLPLLSNVAILDYSNTTPTVIFLDNIMEGVDGAAAFGFTQELRSIQQDDNQQRGYATAYSLDIRVVKADDANVAILKDIVESQRKVQIAGYSPDGVLAWTEPTQLVFSEQIDVLQVNPIQATILAPSGYSGGDDEARVPVFAGENLLRVYDVSTGNASSLHGFYETALITTSQADGYMNVVTTSSGIGVRCITRPIPFPWRGKNVTASALIANYFNDQTDVASLTIFWRGADAYDGGVATSLIASNTAALDDLVSSAPERVSTEFTAPDLSTLFYASFGFLFSSSQLAGDHVNFAEPALTVGGQTGYSI
jgi:hypothetical protein